MPEDLDRAALYAYSVLKIGAGKNGTAGDSLAFEMVRRRPDTSPIIFSRLCGRPPFVRRGQAVEKRRKKVEQESELEEAIYWGL